MVTIIFVLVLVGGFLLFSVARPHAFPFLFGPSIDKHMIAQNLGDSFRKTEFPVEAVLDSAGRRLPISVRYTIDAPLQSKMQKLFEQYRPDYGSLVAVEADTGKVLAMVSFTKERHQDELGHENLSLKAIFPAASVFKVVTATAAIDKNKVSAQTVIPYNGKANTLYKRNVRSSEVNRWTRFITLKEAFGMSVNTVFGKLGAFYLGPQELLNYAKKYGFNHPIEADLPLDESRVVLEENDPWALVEAASGFTKNNTMSPVHGALIAAAVVNNGIMMEPFVVESLSTPQGKSLYQAEREIASVVMNPPSAQEVRALMRETVRRGTSRSSFRGLLRQKKYRDLEVGGKTGSLTGLHPRGKCDWFVGYAEGKNRKIAVAALTVHKKYWTVKSAYLARRFIEEYFRQNP